MIYYVIGTLVWVVVVLTASSLLTGWPLPAQMGWSRP